MQSPVLCNDNAFGPALGQHPSCRSGGFDFTLLFEELILQSLPAILFLSLVPVRIWAISRRPQIVHWRSLKWAKLATIIVLSALSLASLVYRQSTGYANLLSRATLAAELLPLLAYLATALLSPLEHNKCPQPSALLSIFLFFTAIFDAVYVRTIWLITGPSEFAWLRIASLLVKLLLTVLEAVNKSGHIKQLLGPESTASIYELSLGTWMLPLIFKGNKIVLTSNSLYPIDDGIAARTISQRLRKHWKAADQSKPNALAWALARALASAALLPLLPKVFLVAFTIAQPYMIQTALNYVNDESAPDNHGYGLIAAYTLVYLGIAISTGWYEYLSARFLAMVTSALKDILYDSTLDMNAGDVQTSPPTSLLGTDVGTIAMRMRWIIGSLVNVAHIVLCLYILATRLGALCIAPVVVIVILFFASKTLVSHLQKRQKEFKQAVARRVDLTSSALQHLKGMKMLGLTQMITDEVQNKRTEELECSRSLRMLTCIQVILGNASNYLSPVITLLGYGIITSLTPGAVPNATDIFTSLSLISIVSGPVAEIVSSPPNFFLALEACGRIQEFLNREKHVERRTIMNDQYKDIEQVADTSVVRLKDVTAGWASGKAVLKDLSFDVRPANLTMVIGPSGCGKSTLLQLILGEAGLQSGTVQLSTRSIAYCSQSPFLVNRTILQNIIAEQEYDEHWYRTCLQACALDADLKQLTQGDNSLVGTKGVMLSGGQKQRIALARAFYSRRKLILLDDCFSGLDAETAEHCFQSLLGPDGLYKKMSATVVLVTHAVKWLPGSDHVIALDSNGSVQQAGSFHSLAASPGYVHDLDVKERSVSATTSGHVSRAASPKPDEAATRSEILPSPAEASAADKSDGGDVQDMLWYARTLGLRSLFFFALLVIAATICKDIQPLWLGWWVKVGPDANDIFWLGIYILLGFSALAFLYWNHRLFMVTLMPASANLLHHKVLETTMTATMTFLSNTDAGVLLNRFTKDMTSVDMALPIAVLIFTELAASTTGSLILLSLSTGFMAAVMPFLAVALYYFQRFYLKTSRQLRILDLEADAPLIAHLTETVEGLHTIRAFQWQGFFGAQNSDLIDLSQKPDYAMTMLGNWLDLTMHMVVSGLAVIFMTLVVSLRHRVDSTVLGVGMIALVDFSDIMTMFVIWWTRLETNLGTIKRTRDYLRDTPREPKDTYSDEELATTDDASVKYEAVSAAYSATGPKVLQDINLDIPAGQRIAICGRTGSGKSTLASLLLRLLDPQDGKLALGGHDICHSSPESVRRFVCSLPQEAYFLPGTYTVRANLDPLGQSTEGRLLEVLDKVGLAQHIEGLGGLDADLNASQLSAGQRQLFALARAMTMVKGRLLVLDEATSSVDIHTEQVMMDLLKTEFANWTVVAIVHRLSSIADFDRVVVMDKGRLVESGKPSDLLTDENSRFAMLWQHN